MKNSVHHILKSITLAFAMVVLVNMANSQTTIVNYDFNAGSSYGTLTPTDATSINNIELANNAVLYQNAPNPFGNGTTIKYFLPANADAQVVFYDEFGSQLKTFKIAENGNGQLNIDSSNLAAGMYSYSLVVNGKVVDTKKMMCSK